MPRDVSGNTQPLPGTIVSTGDTILPSQHNPMVNDVYAMMTQSLSRDGQGGMRAPLDMSNYRVKNVGAATLDTDAVSFGQSKSNGVPVGAITDFAGQSAPSKWLLCYGQAVSRTEYAALFSVIGTIYGAGNGSTTFNLPDCRGCVTAGKDDMGGSDSTRLSGTWGAAARTLGRIFGFATVALDIVHLPPHNHGGVTGAGGSHSHSVFGLDNPRTPQIQGAGGTGTAGANVNTSVAPDHVHAIAMQGGGASHHNVQPTIVMNKIIKVSL